MTPFPPLPCFLYESEGTDFTYPPEDTETIISSSSMRSSIFTSPTSSTNRDLLSSPNFSVIASSSSTSILFCFALLLRIAVSSFIVSFRSFFYSCNFSLSRAVSLLSGISNMCDACIFDSLNFFINDFLAISTSFDALIVLII